MDTMHTQDIIAVVFVVTLGLVMAFLRKRAWNKNNRSHQESTPPNPNGPKVTYHRMGDRTLIVTETKSGKKRNHLAVGLLNVKHEEDDDPAYRALARINNQIDEYVASDPVGKLNLPKHH